MTQDEINQREWEDGRNWPVRFLGIYVSPQDSRLWVPRRLPFLSGTLNLGHRRAGQLLVVFVATLALLVMAIVQFG